MKTLKTTTNIPTELDADVFARLFIYAKMQLLKKAINDLFDAYMEEVPHEANILLEEIGSGNLLKLLSIDGSAKLVESLSETKRISSIYREMIDAGRENKQIDVQQCTSLYNASSDSQLRTSQGCKITCEDTPNAYPFNTEICPHNTRFPWIEPNSWNRR